MCQEAQAQPPDKLPIILVHVESLTPLDIGLEIGQQSKRLFADIEFRYDSHLMSSFTQMSFDDMLRERLPELKSHIDNRYQKELEGVASAWTLVHDNKLGDGHLSWDEYWVLNLMADMGMPANGTGFGVLSALSKEKGSIVGRNLDLKSTPLLRSLQAITVYQYDDRAVINIGFAGIISVLTGFNESGLFVAHLNAGSDSSFHNPYHVKKVSKEGIQFHGFALRKVLETQVSVRSATSELAKNTYGISSNTIIADKRNIQVLEYSSEGRTEVRHWNSKTRPDKQWSQQSQIAVVNCHVLNGLSAACQRAKDTYRWSHLHRLSAFTDDKKAGVQDIAEIMLNKHNQYYEILSSDTLQSMVYLPSTGHLYLYVASENSTDMPASYKVYYQDILPMELRNVRNKTDYFWWIAGLLALLVIALWMIRRSVKEKAVETEGTTEIKG